MIPLVSLLLVPLSLLCGDLIATMNDEMKIGFIGFGEAGFHIARGLRGAGLSFVCAYDINARAPGLGEKIRRRAAEAEVPLLESNAELAAASDVLLSTVTANRSLEAADCLLYTSPSPRDS